jgi:hypothetical protein
MRKIILSPVLLLGLLAVAGGAFAQTDPPVATATAAQDGRPCRDSNGAGLLELLPNRPSSRENVQEDAKLSALDVYGILDFSLIISPSTANLPYP